MYAISIIKLCIKCNQKLKIDQLPMRGQPVIYSCINSDCQRYFEPTHRYELTAEKFEVEELPSQPIEKKQESFRKAKRQKPIQVSLFDKNSQLTS